MYKRQSLCRCTLPAQRIAQHAPLQLIGPLVPGKSAHTTAALQPRIGLCGEGRLILLPAGGYLLSCYACFPAGTLIPTAASVRLTCARGEGTLSIKKIHTRLSFDHCMRIFFSARLRLRQKTLISLFFSPNGSPPSSLLYGALHIHTPAGEEREAGAGIY